MRQLFIIYAQSLEMCGCISTDELSIALIIICSANISCVEYIDTINLTSHHRSSLNLNIEF